VGLVVANAQAEDRETALTKQIAGQTTRPHKDASVLSAVLDEIGKGSAMRQKKKRTKSWARNACLGVIGMLCLAACASAPTATVLTRTNIERAMVPTSLLTVAAEPEVPESRMQSAAADYIVHLKINDDECHLDVGTIAATQQ